MREPAPLPQSKSEVHSFLTSKTLPVLGKENGGVEGGASALARVGWGLGALGPAWSLPLLGCGPEHRFYLQLGQCSFPAPSGFPTSPYCLGDFSDGSLPFLAPL